MYVCRMSRLVALVALLLAEVLGSTSSESLELSSVKNVTLRYLSGGIDAVSHTDCTVA